MKKYLIFAIIAFVVSFFPFAAHALFKATKFTVNVVDEKGEPITGIRVGVGFEKNTGWGTDSSGQQGVSGADGKQTFSGQSNGHITYGGSKEGYYPSYYDYDFKDLGPFGWKPWNPELKIVMRKIGNPVPMYARNAGMEREIEVLVLNEDIGFDLIASDWVSPYGNGQLADFIFHLKKSYTNTTNFTSVLTLKFNNENDGIINIQENFENGSIYKLPRFAPKDNYIKLSEFSHSRKDGIISKSFNQSDSYIFRVRSKVKNDGEVIALFGKLRGAITVSGFRDEKPILIFKYYLNPDGTRNLEFDPSQNLFDKLPILERVKEP